MNIETARALVDKIDAGAYELSEALEWALDELDSQGEAVSACLPPGSRSAEVMQAYNEGAVISIGDILRIAAEVDELRSMNERMRESKTELNGIMEAMTKGANESDIITKLLELLRPDESIYHMSIEESNKITSRYARACEIAGRAK